MVILRVSTNPSILALMHHSRLPLLEFGDGVEMMRNDAAWLLEVLEKVSRLT
jgi:hypothetical protein